MEIPQRRFTIVPGAFLGNVFDQETRQLWERRSIGNHQQQLFWVGWAVQVRHRRYEVWFDTTPKHYWHLLCYITLQRLLWYSTPPPCKTFKWTSPDQDNRVIVGTTCCCALHHCWWCITWPLGTMGGPTPLVWTIPCPWRPPTSFYGCVVSQYLH